MKKINNNLNATVTVITVCATLKIGSATDHAVATWIQNASKKSTELFHVRIFMTIKINNLSQDTPYYQEITYSKKKLITLKALPILQYSQKFNLKIKNVSTNASSHFKTTPSFSTTNF